MSVHLKTFFLTNIFYYMNKLYSRNDHEDIMVVVVYGDTSTSFLAFSLASSM